MSYSKLLKKLIAESEYSYSDIVEKCNQYGRKIDKAYLSRVVNGKVQAPSEDLSRILSKIFDIDSRRLVFEGYLEKAPEEIVNAFLSIKVTLYLIMSNIFDNKLEEQNLKEYIEIIKEEPLADFIISLIDVLNNNDTIDNQLKLIHTNGNSLNYQFEEPLAIPILDNAMFPTIIQGSKIILKIQSNYEEGDILAVKLKKEENIIIRMAFINGENIKLMPLNKQFDTLTYNLKDIVILGKVTKVITDI